MEEKSMQFANGALAATVNGAFADIEPGLTGADASAPVMTTPATVVTTPEDIALVTATLNATTAVVNAVNAANS
ncbi:MAG: hypothetical protein INR72_19075 [Williamsia herbipolensis]|nr:hypothetical protein [Williamsia serinedens]MBE7163348.1 hypothetical protein [Williamsia herbipolensis]